MKDNDILDFLDDIDDNNKCSIESEDRRKIVKLLHSNDIIHYNNNIDDITFPIAWVTFKIYKIETNYHFVITNSMKKIVNEFIEQDLDKLLEEMNKVFDFIKQDIYKFIRSV